MKGGAVGKEPRPEWKDVTGSIELGQVRATFLCALRRRSEGSSEHSQRRTDER